MCTHGINLYVLTVRGLFSDQKGLNGSAQSLFFFLRTSCCSLYDQHTDPVDLINGLTLQVSFLSDRQKGLKAALFGFSVQISPTQTRELIVWLNKRKETKH